jgi:predicted lipoprotein with Yx(FWY)xxD motif
MNRKLVIGGAAAGVVLAASAGLALGTTGNASSPASGGSYSASAPNATTAPATVGTRSSALGQFLVDGSGRTLYLFEADQIGSSACTGGCASAWPPLTTTGPARAVDGAATGQLGTLRRADGTTQVTYAGHPLYTFAGDTGPGMTNGQGLNQFGGAWYVLGSGGAKIDND